MSYFVNIFIEKILVHPTLGNLVLWRGIYLSDGIYHVDGIRVMPLSEPRFYEGGSVRRFDLDSDYPEIDKNSVLYNDIMRFSRFAGGYLIKGPDDTVGDLRYSALPNSTSPLWSIGIDTGNPDRHVRYSRHVSRASTNFDLFWKMIIGKDIN